MNARACLAILLFAAAPAGAAILNDVQSQLNPTSVEAVFTPRSTVEIQTAVKLAIQEDLPISIGGGRHAMGGQQFGAGNLHIDMSSMTRVVGLDTKNGLVTVEAGATWPVLVDWLNNSQKDAPAPWGIRQKQSGADRLTIGGALSANAHGRGLAMRPIIADVESFTLVDASAELLVCSRTQNPELFRLAIGGYGLFGVIANVTLRLSPRTKMERVLEITDVSTLNQRFSERVRDGFLYGDFQYMTDPASPDFMRKGVFSCYRPASPDAKMPARQKELSEADWREFYFLAHADKKKAWDRYSSYYKTTNGQLYWSDSHQLSAYVDDYHAEVSARMKERDKATEVISELYVPRDRHAAFMEEVRAYALEKKMDLVYGTVRLIEKDDESVLAWAREPWICTIVNLHVVHTAEGLQKAQREFRDLIDLALTHGGSYSLTYHRWATKEQVLKAHPRFVEFMKLKRKFDPERRFRSEWYRHYADMFSSELTATKAP